MNERYNNFLIIPAPNQTYGIIADKLVPVTICPEDYAIMLASTHNVILPPGHEVALGVPKWMETFGLDVTNIGEGIAFLPGSSENRSVYSPEAPESLN